MSESGTFDYIIVGAGSAGCVLANRLTENPSTTVCLLEAGPPDKSIYIHVPTGVIKTAHLDSINWRYFSKPQETMGGRPIFTPRGKTLGGTSSINGMVYMRGNPLDYDEWAALGNDGWSWADVRPYFLKSENNEQFGNDEHHNSGGPLNVTLPNITSPLQRDFVAAAESLQYKHNPDFNGDHQEGFGQHQVTQKNGRRWSAAMAFLRPATNRPNLTVLTDAPVARLTIEDSRATGVELIDGRHLSANGEVLLCAGTIVSPKILMQSGIGDAAELKAVGIEPIANLPGVGKNLQDHAASAVIMRTKSRTPWGFSWAKAPSLAFDALRYLTARKGFFAAQLIESGGFIKTSPDLDRPDIQFVFVPGHRAPPPKVIEVGHGYSCFAVLLRPKSRGTVTLASADPAAAPVIDPCFYTEEEDMKLMLKALKENRRLTNADAFKKYEPYEVMPGDKVQSDDALEEYIRNTGGTIFHPVGTCKMGRDDTAVVDERLRVYGLDGLRIVDASIMPLICGGNTNAPVIMFGEKASDMIKEDAGRAVRLGTGNIAPSESRAA